MVLGLIGGNKLRLLGWRSMMIIEGMGKSPGLFDSELAVDSLLAHIFPSLYHDFQTAFLQVLCDWGNNIKNTVFLNVNNIISLNFPLFTPTASSNGIATLAHIFLVHYP